MSDIKLLQVRPDGSSNFLRHPPSGRVHEFRMVGERLEVLGPDGWQPYVPFAQLRERLRRLAGPEADVTPVSPVPPVPAWAPVGPVIPGITRQDVRELLSILPTIRRELGRLPPAVARELLGQLLGEYEEGSA